MYLIGLITTLALEQKWMVAYFQLKISTGVQVRKMLIKRRIMNSSQMENTENVMTFLNLQVLSLLISRLICSIIMLSLIGSIIILLVFVLSDVDNGCQEHYEPAGNLCIRASIFPETYENAQSRCQSDGGYLLSITTSEIQVLKI